MMHDLYMQCIKHTRFSMVYDYMDVCAINAVMTKQEPKVPQVPIIQHP